MVGLFIRIFYPGFLKGVYLIDNYVDKVNRENYEIIHKENKNESSEEIDSGL